MDKMMLSEEIIEAVKAYGRAYSMPNTTASELYIRIQDIRALLARFGQTAQPNVPEPLKYGGAWKDHYVTGWNNCRAAMLEAAPEPKEPR